MSHKRNNFRLGITVIVMFVLLFGSLIFIGGGELFKPDVVPLTVRFVPGTSLPEISPGSFVTYFGQPVGKVVSAELVTGTDPRQPERGEVHFLEVRAEIRADLELRSDVRVVGTGPPLGGRGQLDIIDRGKNKDLLDGDAPVYAQVTGFSAILDRISHELDEGDPESLLASIKLQFSAEQEGAMVYNVNHVLSGVRLQLDPSNQDAMVSKINRSLDDINETTAQLKLELDRQAGDTMLNKVHASLDRIRGVLEQVVALVQDNRPKIDSTLSAVQSGAVKLDEQILAALAREFEMSEPAAATLLTKFHSAFDHLNKALANLETTTTDFKGVMALNKERINELIENTSTASQALKLGIKDLSLHPWKLLFEPGPAEKRELHLYNTAREFAEAAAHLDDATMRLKALSDLSDGAIPAGDPALQEIRADLSEAVQRFRQAEQALGQALIR